MVSEVCPTSSTIQGPPSIILNKVIGVWGKKFVLEVEKFQFKKSILKKTNIEICLANVTPGAREYTVTHEFTKQNQPIGFSRFANYC